MAAICITTPRLRDIYHSINTFSFKHCWNVSSTWSNEEEFEIYGHRYRSIITSIFPPWGRKKQSSSRAIAKVQEEKVSKVAGKIKWRISSWWRTGGGSMQTQNSISRSLFTSNDALELISWSEDCSTPVVCTNLLSFPFWSDPLHLIRFLFLFIVAGKEKESGTDEIGIYSALDVDYFR